MSFASIVFILFLTAVFLLYYCHPSRQWQNWVLLAASYFFYGWWDYRFCGLMLFSSLVDYVIGWRIARADKARPRKLLLAASIGINLAVLGFFKYFNFFADSFAVLLASLGVDTSTSTLSIILPVGISFYTFQTLSYTIDIYRRQFEPRQELVEYLTFVSFFPQLVAGPIERAKNLLPQFSKIRRFCEAEAVAGCRLMLWGFAKKMILADNLGAIVDHVYARAGTATGAELAFATVCFASQIYCDFSAYSDIAAGAASLFGIKLMRNFAYPYFSQSLSEFWRRWHISLSQWFRDYVFIPLGGSQCSTGRTSANVLATMLLSGLWHGASWHFVAWGMLHGLFLVVERGGKLEGPAGESAPGGNFMIPDLRVLRRMITTFFLVSGAWVLFRAESLEQAFDIYYRIGEQAMTPQFYGGLVELLTAHTMVLVALVVFVMIEWIGRSSWNPLRVEALPRIARWFAYTGLFWCILYLGSRETADFIYFQF